MQLIKCPYTDCPFRADNEDDMDDHVIQGHQVEPWETGDR